MQVELHIEDESGTVIRIIKIKDGKAVILGEIPLAEEVIHLVDKKPKYHTFDNNLESVKFPSHPRNKRLTRMHD